MPLPTLTTKMSFISLQQMPLTPTFNSWWRQSLLVFKTKPYTVSIYTATMDQSEFKYRCWVWILFFIWNAWIIERERRWGGIHSGDGWSRLSFRTYISSLLNGIVERFQHVKAAWVRGKFWRSPPKGFKCINGMPLRKQRACQVLLDAWGSFQYHLYIQSNENDIVKWM